MNYGQQSENQSEYYDQSYPQYDQSYPQYDQQSSYGTGTGASFNIMDYTPMGMLKNQLWCTAVSIVVIFVLVWLLGMIPIVGPWVVGGIRWVFTKIAELLGVIKCGFANNYSDIRNAEKNN